MRWLFLKDLRLLRRSPFLVALLIIYPALVALLIGLALSRGPDKPRVAFLNEVPEGQSTIDLGGKHVDLSRYSTQFFQAVDPVRVDTREQAVAKVRSGDALAALIIPSDIVDKLATGVEQARVEVIYNGDALKQSFVQSTIDAKLAQANGALADRLRDLALQDVRLLIDGGHLTTPLGDFDLLGLTGAERILNAAVASLPRSDPRRAPLRRVAAFAKLAHDGLGFARAGAAFGALGVAVGALAREVRAASLLAIMLTLPLAFLALVPSGAVAGGLYDVIRVVSALFPFKPALQALDAAVNDARPALPGPPVHLAVLALAFGVLARVALGRFA